MNEPRTQRRGGKERMELRPGEVLDKPTKPAGYVTRLKAHRWRTTAASFKRVLSSINWSLPAGHGISSSGHRAPLDDAV